MEKKVKFIDALKDEVCSMTDNSERITEKCWGMEYGILITGDQAIELISESEKLDKAHELFEKLYDSGIGLQEYTVEVKRFLGFDVP